METRNFRAFIAGMMAAELGYQVLSVAIAWHIFLLRHSAFDLGLIGLALFLPIAVLSLPAGMFIDHLDRRTIIVASALVQATGCVALVAAVVADIRIVGIFLAILVVVGCGRAFFQPAVRTVLPNIVPREQFVSAQAAYSSIRQLVTITGPAVGGALVAFGAWIAFLVAAVAFGLAVLCLGTIRIERLARSGAAPSWRDALEGLRFIGRQPIIAGALTLDLFAVLFGGAVALLPAYAADVFHVGATGLGALRSASAVGAAIVAGWLAGHPPTRHVGRTLLLTVTGFGFATIAFGVSTNFWVALVLLAVIGGTDVLSMVIRNSMVQLSTPDSMRGRVSSVELVFIGASNQLGAFESGTVAALVGVVPSVVIGGVGTLAVIGLCSLIFPKLRKLDRFTSIAVEA